MNHNAIYRSDADNSCGTITDREITLQYDTILSTIDDIASTFDPYSCISFIAIS